MQETESEYNFDNNLLSLAGFKFDCETIDKNLEWGKYIDRVPYFHILIKHFLVL